MDQADALGRPTAPSAERGAVVLGRAQGPSALSPEQAKAILQDLRRLALSPGEQAQEMDGLVRLLRESDYRSEVTQVLQEAMASTSPNPHVGALWIRRLVTSKAWDRSYPDALEVLSRRGELGRRAVLEFLEQVGRKKRRALVLKTLQCHGKWLESDARGWPLMARGLASSGCYSRAVRWTRQWETRPEAGWDVLYSRAQALRALGRGPAARTVMAAALLKEGPVQEVSELRVWYAMELALAGETEEAARVFQEIKPQGWDDDAMCSFYLARGVIRVKQAPAESRAEAFDSAYMRIIDRFQGRQVHRRDWVLRREYRRCMWRMALDARRYGAALAIPWRTADSVWMVPILLVIPPLQLLLPVYVLRLCFRREAKRRYPGPH